MLDDMNPEFPSMNQHYIGQKSRYTYNQLIPLPTADSGVKGPGLEITNET